MTQLYACETNDDCEELCKQLCTKYEPVSLPSKDTIIKKLNEISHTIKLNNDVPMMALIGSMCYCCT